MTWLPPYLEPIPETEVLEHLRDESDRAVGIIAGSAVEGVLTAALQTRLRSEPELIKRLFRPSGPLGPFSNKIDLGYLIGLYGKKTYRDLVTIKDIRNTFAHDMTKHAFADESIAARCANLVLIEQHTKEKPNPVPTNKFRTGFPIWLENREEWLKAPRTRYVVAVLAFCMLLHWVRLREMKEIEEEIGLP